MEEILQVIKSECTVFLDKPPCCLDFSPDYQNYFVVGTYNLLPEEGSGSRGDGEAINESTVQRNGSLVLFKLAENEIIKISTVEVSYGILDVHFCGSSLGVASSVGTFAVYKFSPLDVNSTPRLAHVGTLRVSDPSTVVTSFAWHPFSAGKRVCVTLSTGEIGLVSVSQDNAQAGNEPSGPIEAPIQTIYAHSLEAWIAVFSPLSWSDNSASVFSGGDDAVICCSELTERDAEAQDVIPNSWLPRWTNKRIHNAGVTAILPFSLSPLPSTETALSNSAQAFRILLTGSYDDTLRVLHLPSTDAATLPRNRQPRVLYEIPLPGGVWRLKLLSQRILPAVTSLPADPTAKITLLVSCMYAGAFVVQISIAIPAADPHGADTEISCTHEILGHFSEHESMCYACDAQPLPSDSTCAASTSRHSDDNEAGGDKGQDKGSDHTRQIVSCSFYDRRVCLWRWKEKGRC